MSGETEDPWSLFDGEEASGDDVVDAVASSVPPALAPSAAAAAAATQPAPGIPAAGADATDAASPRIAPHVRISISPGRILPLLGAFLSSHASTTVADLSAHSDTTPPDVASATADIVKHFEAMVAVAQRIQPRKSVSGAKGKGRRVVVSPPSPEELGPAIDDMCEHADAVIDRTWAWMQTHGSWPHVAWREAYVMAQLARSCGTAMVGELFTAMEAADMALILGAPSAQLDDLIKLIDMAVVAAREATEAVVAATSSSVPAPSPAPAPPLPSMPAVLGPDAVLQLPADMLAAAATGGAHPIPRVYGQSMRKLTKPGAAAKAAAAAASAAATRPKGGRAGALAAAAAAAAATAGSAPTTAMAAAPVSAASLEPGMSEDAGGVEEHPLLAALRRPTCPEGTKPLTLKEFRAQYVKRSTPVVLLGVTAGWPALSKWRDLAWLTQRYGHRTVPIEIGQHLSGVWAERTLKLEAFVKEYMVPSLQWGWGNCVKASTAGVRASDAAVRARGTPDAPTLIHPERIAYLAQHTLLDQIPSLIDDVDIPLYAGDQVGSINAWFGTAGTVTRAHFDSYENCFVQVAGYKYVRMYPPSASAKLYPYAKARSSADAAAGADATTSQGNISAVDVENPDLSLHPLAGEAEYVETVVGPGDMLYMPAGWWHYVRSLTPSFSLNFWF